MPKLCQINALVTGRKGEAEKFVTEQYKILQKPELFSGFVRTYRPHDEVTGEKKPPESQKVQFTAMDLIKQSMEKWIELWNLTATQDRGNQSAIADLVVDGFVILHNVPVTTLLFLEKQVNDLETFVSKLPVPDNADSWNHDSATGLLRGTTSESISSKKEPSHYEKSPATKEHPAQVEFFYKDVPVGTWTKTNFSGAVTADKKKEFAKKIKKLKDAIKLAREEANSIEVSTEKIGESLFDYVFQE